MLLADIPQLQPRRRCRALVQHTEISRRMRKIRPRKPMP